MIRINLLPFRKAKRLENLRMQISVFVLSVVLVGIVVGSSYMTKSGELEDIKKENTRLNKELQSYAAMLNKIKTLKSKRKDLQAKLDVIRGLEAQKAGPVQLFDEICLAVPEGKVFLKSLGETGTSVRMAGEAIDYDTVAQFMTNLEKTKTLDKVVLGSTTQSERENQTICSFNLTCTRSVGKK